MMAVEVAPIGKTVLSPFYTRGARARESMTNA
jgi:hypothetical protein